MTDILRARANGVSGEIEIDLAFDSTYQARLYGYTDDPTSIHTGWTWPVLLDPGRHTLDGLTDGLTYGLYVLLVDGTGAPVSAPSNLAKARPYSIIEKRVALSRSPIEEVEAHGVLAYRIQISAASLSGDMTKYIFLYQREPTTGLTDYTADALVGVCTPSALEQFPVGAPQEGEPPFYRLDTVDVIESGLEEIEYLWDSLVAAALGLGLQLDELQQIERTVRIDLTSGDRAEPSLSSVSLSYSSLSFSSSSRSGSSARSSSSRPSSSRISSSVRSSSIVSSSLISSSSASARSSSSFLSSSSSSIGT